MPPPSSPSIKESSSPSSASRWSVAARNLAAVELLRRGSFAPARDILKLALATFQRGLAEAEAAAEAAEAATPATEAGGIDDQDPMACKGNSQNATRSREDEDSRGKVIVALVSLGGSSVHADANESATGSATEGPYYPLGMGMVLLEATTTSSPTERGGEYGCTCEDSILYATLTNTVRATATLLFNVAATFHLEAMALATRESADKSNNHQGVACIAGASLLTRALRLYDLILGPTLRILSSGPSPRQGLVGCVAVLDEPASQPAQAAPQRGRGDTSSIRIRAAAWNQKGHAHHLLGQRDGVKACALELDDLTRAVPTSSTSGSAAREGAAGADSPASLASVLGGRAAQVVALNVYLHSPFTEAVAEHNRLSVSSE
jgi:hypothetical protein